MRKIHVTALAALSALAVGVVVGVENDDGVGGPTAVPAPISKYARLGSPFLLADTPALDAGLVERVRGQFIRRGLRA